MKGVLRIPQSTSTAGTSPSDCHIQDTRWGGVLPLCREAVGVFYSPSRLGNNRQKACISVSVSVSVCYLASVLSSARLSVSRCSARVRWCPSFEVLGVDLSARLTATLVPLPSLTSGSFAGSASVIVPWLLVVQSRPATQQLGQLIQLDPIPSWLQAP